MSAQPSKGSIVVTGASGMLGSHLCADLSRRGFEVRALVRVPASFEAPPGVRTGLCDLPDAIEEHLLEEAAALVHCAWATRATDLAESRRVNEEGTRRLLEASRRAGVPRFVFISTLIARLDAPSHYARSKHALEGLLDPSRDLVVRPGLILARSGHGLFQQMRDSMLRTHAMPLFGGGRQPLQTVHVDDVCEALTRALDRRLKGALNVAEPEPLELRSFLRLLAGRLGVRCLLVPLPFAPVLAAIRALEALRVPFPLRSESLLGIRALRHMPVEADLAKLDLVVRSARESLADVV
jgi:nucleoside-diphosphate-sugar epimerase